MNDLGPLTREILQIPIRPDATVCIHPIPHDLTKAEANKLANVIMAMAEPNRLTPSSGICLDDEGEMG